MTSLANVVEAIPVDASSSAAARADSAAPWTVTPADCQASTVAASANVFPAPAGAVTERSGDEPVGRHLLGAVVASS